MNNCLFGGAYVYHHRALLRTTSMVTCEGGWDVVGGQVSVNSWASVHSVALQLQLRDHGIDGFGSFDFIL